jgi:hypothetical protein
MKCFMWNNMKNSSNFWCFKKEKKMFEHILKFKEINSDNEWIGYFTTGLKLSAFETVCIEFH